MYFLDTNILSPLLAPAPPASLASRIAETPSRYLFTSSLNKGELLFGLVKGRKGPPFFSRLQRLLELIQVLSFDAHCADVYGQVRAEMSAKEGHSRPWTS